MDNNLPPNDDVPPGDTPPDSPAPPSDGRSAPQRTADPDPPGQFRVVVDVKSFGIGAAFGLLLASLFCGRGCDRVRC